MDNNIWNDYIAAAIKNTIVDLSADSIATIEKYNFDFDFERILDEESTSGLDNENEETHSDIGKNFIVNQVRIENEEDKDKHEEELYELLKSEEYEAGINSKAEEFANILISSSKDSTQIIINKIYLKALYDCDYTLINSLLYVISSIKYEDIYPVGQTIALAAANLEDRESAANAIRAFEYWGKIDTIKFLDQVKYSSPWIEKYKQKVIKRLSEKGQI